MGTMGPLLTAHAAYSEPSVPGVPGDALLQGYRSCLQQALRHLVEYERTPTSDPRVSALSAHLARRQAVVELQDEVHRRAPPPEQVHDVRRQLLGDYFRGVDLHYTASAWEVAR